MLFNSLEFVVFAAVVYPLYFALRSWSWRTSWLLLASWVFYVTWSALSPATDRHDLDRLPLRAADPSRGRDRERGGTPARATARRSERRDEPGRARVLQVRAVLLRDDAGVQVNAALGLPARSRAERVQGGLREDVVLTTERARMWYAERFVESPVAAMLRALAEDLRTWPGTTLFIVAPVNRDGLRRLGFDLADLDVRVEQLRRHVGARPEEWLDTGGQFQAADFRDAVHVYPPAVERLARIVAHALASRLDTAGAVAWSTSADP
jgi:hypothetical protein